MKVLAVDYGLKRVGLASGLFETKIAFPKGVIFRKEDDENVIKELLRICRDEGYDKVVFGMPYNMDGTKSKMHEIIQAFVAKFKGALLKEGLSISVDVVDERLSSFEADAYVGDLPDAKRADLREKNGERDMMAAKVILERYFG